MELSQGMGPLGAARGEGTTAQPPRSLGDDVVARLVTDNATLEEVDVGTCGLGGAGPFGRHPVDAPTEELLPGVTGSFVILRKDVQKREFHLHAVLSGNPQCDCHPLWPFDEASSPPVARVANVDAACASTEEPASSCSPPCEEMANVAQGASPFCFRADAPVFVPAAWRPPEQPRADAPVLFPGAAGRRLRAARAAAELRQAVAIALQAAGGRSPCPWDCYLCIDDTPKEVEACRYSRGHADDACGLACEENNICDCCDEELRRARLGHVVARP